MTRRALLIPLLTASLLAWSIFARATSPNDALLVLYGFDAFSKEHLKRLCSALRDARSLAPIVVFDPDDELLRFSQATPDHGTELAADDLSSAKAHATDATILGIQSRVDQRLAQGSQISCSVEPGSNGEKRRMNRLILANESVIRRGALAYGEVLFNTEGGFERKKYTVLELDHDTMGPNHALAEEWGINLPEPEPRPEPAPPTKVPRPLAIASPVSTKPRSEPTSLHTYLRGAVPGLLVVVSSAIPYLMAQNALGGIERDCDGRASLDDCNFRERSRDVHFWAGLQRASLWGGIGLASAGFVACTLDACIWPSTWWFGNTPSGTAWTPVSAHVTVSANAINFCGSF